MAARGKSARKSPSRSGSASRNGSKALKEKALQKSARARSAAVHAPDPATLLQLKLYEEGLKLVQEQKFAKAKQSLEKVLGGPSTELADRARVHLRGVEQRLSRVPAPSPKTADDHYTQGVAMMNLGRWDDAARHFDASTRLCRAWAAPMWSARTALEWSEMEMRSGLISRDQIEARLDECQEVAHRHGQLRLVERAADLRSRLAKWG